MHSDSQLNPDIVWQMLNILWCTSCETIWGLLFLQPTLSSERETVFLFRDEKTDEKKTCVVLQSLNKSEPFIHCCFSVYWLSMFAKELNKSIPGNSSTCRESINKSIRKNKILADEQRLGSGTNEKRKKKQDNFWLLNRHFFQKRRRNQRRKDFHFLLFFLPSDNRSNDWV